MASDHVNAVLSEVEVSASETPAQLRARADALMGEYRAAVAAPMRLSAEMAQFRAPAGAIERRDAARVPVAQAEDALAAAEDAFAPTAQPEEEAATRSTRARHLFEKARDELLQARENGAEPARARRTCRPAVPHPRAAGVWSSRGQDIWLCSLATSGTLAGRARAAAHQAPIM